MIPIFLLYLVFINLLAAVIFIWDKRKARKDRQRISEKTLHGLEFLGGVFAIIFCMYFFYHKNKKASYYLISYIFLFLWIACLHYIYISPSA